MQPISKLPNRAQVSRRRRGSTLLIVVALLGMLAFLGFVFYTFAKQERANAVSFSLGNQTLKSPSLEPDALFDFVLQQLIVGPPDSNFQSILWGGRHSLLANMFGRDGIPWNGEGVNLIQDQVTQTTTQPFTYQGQPRVDMGYNVSFSDPNDNQGLLALVDSAAANSGSWTYSTSDAGWSTFTDVNNNSFVKRFQGFGTVNTNEYIPEPDVNYNSPDINSLFLSYDGTTTGIGGANPTRVIIPSFLRPQYLRTVGATMSQPITQWYLNAAPNQVMRPHPGHRCVVSDGSGNPQVTNISRYTTEADYEGLGLRRPFSFFSYAPEPIMGNAVPAGNLGVWNAAANGTVARVVNGVSEYEYDLDVDTDGDGVLDSILMDLGYPPVRRGDGKLVVPLFAVSIRDLNGLLNVNATGNLSGNLNLNSLSNQNQLAVQNGATPTDQLGFRANGSTVETGAHPGTLYNFVPDNLSKSNLGLTTFEINPQRALTADPTFSGGSPNDPSLVNSEAALQLSCFLRIFDGTISPGQPGRSIAELANLEWLMLNVGRVNFHLGLASGLTQAALPAAITDIFPGRNGEATQAFSTGPASSTPSPAFNATPSVKFNSVPSVPTGNVRIMSYDDNTNAGNPQFYPYTPVTTPPATGDVLVAGTSKFLTTGSAFDLPKPGLSTTWNPNTTGTASPTPLSWPPFVSNINSDDNLNPTEGEPNTPNEPSATSSIRWVTPLDFRGSGQQFQRYSWGTDAQPGVASVDDDGDGIIDNFSEEGWIGSDDLIATPSTFYGKQPSLARLANSPLYFPAYSGYHSYYSTANPFYGSLTANPPVPGGVRWGDYGTTPNYFAVMPSASTNPPTSLLMRGSVWNSLIDDPSESIIDPTIASPGYQNYLTILSTNYTASVTPPLSAAAVSSITNAIANDAVFGPEETLFLQGAASDSRLSGNRSRLAELMPGNLVASQSAPDIRKRLTTVSADRREFGFVKSVIGGLRIWEGNPVFPPYNTTAAGTGNPYRPELFYYLQQIASGGSPSQKLNVNRWLFLDSVANQYGFAPLPEQTTVTDTSVHMQNATLVRQNMARDIYTLLYTLCTVHTDGTSYDFDYRLVNAVHVPSAAQTKEIAQFAVNLVDALDTDNIVTAFYYDPDLSNNSRMAGDPTYGANSPGWDSNAFIGPDALAQTSDDFVVYGVERQQLVIAESAAFAVQKKAMDDATTIFNDSLTAATGRTYLFFELQNVTPMNVTLASAGVTFSNAQTMGNWRVRLTDGGSPGTQYNVLYFLPNLDSQNYFPVVANPVGSTSHSPGTDLVLPSGALFSVASQDGSDVIGGSARTSDFRADPSSAGSYSLSVPAVPPNGATDTPVPTAANPAAGSGFVPRCNLDLVWSYGDTSAQRFWLLNGSDATTGLPSTPGAFVSSLAGKTTCQLILETQATAGANPDPTLYTTWRQSVWIPVDNVGNTAPSAPVSLSNGIPITKITPPITASTGPLCSFPRTMPLLSGSAPVAAATNSINTPSAVAISNPNSIAWQLQNDRDFGSLSELLQLPLYGPDQLTSSLAQVINPGSNTVSPVVSNSEFYTKMIGGTKTYFPTIAAARFLRPDNPDYALNGITANTGNRWYRLFDLLEVPNRSHQHPAIFGVPPLGVANGATPAVSFGAAVLHGTPVSFAYPGAPGSTTYQQYQYSPMFSWPSGLPQYYGWPRTHGLVNLNMIRHPQVLSALIDDDQLINDPRMVGASMASPYLDDATGDPQGRQWWIEFLKSRDSRYVAGALPASQFPMDPVTNLYVPGTANARPFRGLDSIGPMANNALVAVGSPQDSPIEDTILRSLPLDSQNSTDGAITPNESRRLFEIGNNIAGGTASEDHFGPIDTEVQNSPIHPSSRYRLMSKLMNNTTTRTNSFAVYVTVQYYEAVEVPSGIANVNAVRIGGLLDDAPVHRGFFVVDRAGAIEQMKVVTANANAANAAAIAAGNPAPYSPTFPVSPASYSFQPNTDGTGIQSNQNGIRWKDLVLYRQTLN